MALITIFSARRRTTVKTLNGIKVTDAAYEAVKRKFEIDDNGKSWDEFTAGISGTIGLDDAIVLPWSGMFLLVETDGYTHS